MIGGQIPGRTKFWAGTSAISTDHDWRLFQDWKRKLPRRVQPMVDGIFDTTQKPVWGNLDLELSDLTLSCLTGPTDHCSNFCNKPSAPTPACPGQVRAVVF